MARPFLCFIFYCSLLTHPTFKLLKSTDLPCCLLPYPVLLFLLPAMSTTSVTSLTPYPYIVHLEKLFQYLVYLLLWITFLDSTNRFDHASLLTSLYIFQLYYNTYYYIIYLLFNHHLSVGCKLLSVSAAWHVLGSYQMHGDSGDEPRVKHTVHLNKAMPSIWRSSGLGHIQRRMVDISLSSSVPSRGCCNFLLPVSF